MKKARRGEDLNLRLVSSLLVVVAEGHFGRAADRLFVTAPALSQQIRRLEEQVGVELVDRSSHPVVLTAAGEVFVADARPALEFAVRAMNGLDALEASAGQAVADRIHQRGCREFGALR